MTVEQKMKFDTIIDHVNSIKKSVTRKLWLSGGSRFTPTHVNAVHTFDEVAHAFRFPVEQYGLDKFAKLRYLDMYTNNVSIATYIKRATKPVDIKIIDTAMKLFAKHVEQSAKWVKTQSTTPPKKVAHTDASETDPLGAIFMAPKRNHSEHTKESWWISNIDIEPNTELEDEIDDALEDHYNELMPLLNRRNITTKINSLIKKDLYTRWLVPDIGVTFYRGIAVNVNAASKFNLDPRDIVEDSAGTLNVNFVVRPKGYSSWSMSKKTAAKFANFAVQTVRSRDNVTDAIMIVMQLTLDSDNVKSFMINQKTSSLYGYSNEHETIQVKPVSVTSIAWATSNAVDPFTNIMHLL